MPVCGFWGGPWFAFPIVGLVLAIAVLFLVFGPRGPFAHLAGRDGWDVRVGGAGGQDAGGAPLDILKRRHANGEVTREQFEQMRRDLA